MAQEPLTRVDAQELARLSAEETVTSLFRTLGVDIHDQKDLNELRSDLIYSRKLRRATERSTAHALLVIVGLVVLGLAKIIWDAVTAA